MSPPNSFQLFQSAIVPGVDGLHRSMRAIFDVTLQSGASILIVGAGGGREIETLGASSKNYHLVGVDPSPEMLDLAQDSVDTLDLRERTALHLGTLESLFHLPIHDAATSFFVMHFLNDDGSKTSYLRAVRQRLRVGAPYLHVDVCFDSPDMYERLRPVYATHAELNGIDPGKADEVARRVGTMPVLPAASLEERFVESGFKVISPFFRGFWYTGWWLETV